MFTLAIAHTKYCIYLGFMMNEELYIKSCKRCHFLLKNYCTKLTEARIIEMHKSSKELNVESSITHHIQNIEQST